ncbi:MAG TPA: hypothetical protein VLG12_06150, partial [Candidatus Saccharimonadales bacterium]|nr:hypothetical protein [Candidatus Saccharimonadales bacterium]
TVWKKQFGFMEEDITIGMFGLLSAHKNYLHGLRTLNLLPAHFKLLIIGEAHHMSIKEWQVDPVIQEMMSYLDSHPTIADRVVFTGKRDDSKYYEDLVNVDFVILPSFEVSQSGSATFSNALELSCAILKSNISNSRGYETYFPNCFEVFDIGNYYETKHKILHFDRTKIENLNARLDLYSEVQIRQIYMSIYESMKESIPVDISPHSNMNILERVTKPNTLSNRMVIRKIFNLMPRPVQSLIRKLRKHYRNALS